MIRRYCDICNIEIDNGTYAGSMMVHVGSKKEFDFKSMSEFELCIDCSIRAKNLVTSWVNLERNSKHWVITEVKE